MNDSSHLNETHKPKYIVTSGWWCGEVADEIRKKQGSEAIRALSFFDNWKQSVLSHTRPQKIMVLDSASPLKPSREQLSDIEFISILDNPGHSTKHTGKYSGYMRSIIMGITYASMCDADYWVYIEQDVLLQGKGIIEKCIEEMRTPFMFGSGKGTYQLLQQSFIIIHKSGFDDFIKRITRIKSRDCEVAPESKFLIASSPIYSKLPEWCFKELTKESYIGMKFLGLLKLISKFHKSFDELPIGYGRSRPINFSEPFLYFQHGSEKELAEYYKTNDTY